MLHSTYAIPRIEDLAVAARLWENPEVHPTLALWIRRAITIGLPIACLFWLYRDVTGRLPAPEKDVNFTDGDLVHVGGPRLNPTVLFFWDAECDGCLPIQSTLDTQAADWEVIGVAVQPGEPSAVDGYHRKHHLHYRSVHDPYRDLASAYGLSTLPTVVFVDKEGRIAGKAYGHLTMLHLHVYYWLALL